MRKNLEISNKEFDVVIVGGGNAALCAAITAARYVDKVILLERAPYEFRGGNSRHTRDIRYAHYKDPYTAGPYTEEEFLEDILKVNKGETDLRLAKLVVKESWNLIDWISKHGVKFQKPLKGTLHLGRTNAFMLGGGKAMLNAYYRTAEKLGVTILYNAFVEDLVIEGDEFKAAVVNLSGKKVLIHGKAAVIASGGFEANIEPLKEAWGKAAENFIIRGTKYNDGLVLFKLIEKGATPVGDPREAHMVAVDHRAPKYDGGIVTRVDSIPFSIVVNKSVERFYDEGEDEWPKRYAIWGKLIAQQPDQIAYSIYDSKVSELFIPPAYKPYRADTLEELASLIGLDSSKLIRLVKEFNQHLVHNCNFDPTRLDDCHTIGLDPPKSHWALPIDTPPFYAYILRPGVTFTYLGVRVDERARVVKSSGGAFKNIYAAGEIMAGNILRRGYLGGFGLTIGTVFGRIAGEMASAHA